MQGEKNQSMLCENAMKFVNFYNSYTLVRKRKKTGKRKGMAYFLKSEFALQNQFLKDKRQHIVSFSKCSINYIC
jgi:hypothetical protein